MTGSKTNLVLLGSLCLAELCGFLIVFSLYRLTQKPDVYSFLTSRPGLLCLTASAGLGLSSGVIFHQFRQASRYRSQVFSLTVAMNLVAVVVTITVGELTLRLLSRATSDGTKVGNLLLLPREWKKAANHYSELLKKATSQETYIIFDRVVGWTVNPNSHSEDGLSFSSVEGIRSPRVGISFSNRSVNCRIALVGDSYTFGEEVTYEESWGSQLESLLGLDCQVLNFGVPGYGIGQIYLKYLRDVRSWSPNIVILGFIGHDVLRTMGVYGFLTFPASEVPWPSPRFVLNIEGRLELLNVPLPFPEEIFTKPSIRALPNIAYDLNYSETEWDRFYWRPLHSSYLFRLVTSVYPLWEMERQQVSSEEMRAINRKLIHSFIESASSAGSIPIIVYLPTKEDLRYYVPLSIKFLNDFGIRYVDLRACFGEHSAENLFAAQGHFSARGNAVVARCLHEMVTGHLSRMAD